MPVTDVPAVSDKQPSHAAMRVAEATALADHRAPDTLPVVSEAAEYLQRMFRSEGVAQAMQSAGWTPQRRITVLTDIIDDAETPAAVKIAAHRELDRIAKEALLFDGVIASVRLEASADSHGARGSLSVEAVATVQQAHSEALRFLSAVAERQPQPVSGILHDRQIDAVTATEKAAPRNATGETAVAVVGSSPPDAPTDHGPPGSDGPAAHPAAVD